MFLMFQPPQRLSMWQVGVRTMKWGELGRSHNPRFLWRYTAWGCLNIPMSWFSTFHILFSSALWVHPQCDTRVKMRHAGHGGYIAQSSPAPRSSTLIYDVILLCMILTTSLLILPHTYILLSQVYVSNYQGAASNDNTLSYSLAVCQVILYATCMTNVRPSFAFICTVFSLRHQTSVQDIWLYVSNYAS